MKVALRQVYEAAAQAQSEAVAKAGLKRWISWASRSRLEPFKRLAKTLRKHWDGVVAGMLQSRNNAYVEAMNGLLQQARAGGSWVSQHREFHLDCLPAHVQAGPPAHQPV